MRTFEPKMLADRHRTTADSFQGLKRDGCKAEISESSDIEEEITFGSRPRRITKRKVFVFEGLFFLIPPYLSVSQGDIMAENHLNLGARFYKTCTKIQQNLYQDSMNLAP